VTCGGGRGGRQAACRRVSSSCVTSTSMLKCIFPNKFSFNIGIFKIENKFKGNHSKCDRPTKPHAPHNLTQHPTTPTLQRSWKQKKTTDNRFNRTTDNRSGKLDFYYYSANHGSHRSQPPKHSHSRHCSWVCHSSSIDK
jgi:hypothetical protein